MRIARCSHDGVVRLAIVVDEELALLDPSHGDVASLLSRGEAALEAVRAEAAGASRIPLEKAALLAPIARPPKYVGIGFNTQDHIDEGVSSSPTRQQEAIEAREGHLAAAFPEPRWPIMFNKQTSSINSPFGEIWAPTGVTTLDYEGEVAVVIGRRTRRATPENAAAAIAGYMVANDVSVRELQFNTSQMWLGKSFETHAPIGPWMTTADEVDEGALRIRTYVNGDLRQDGSFTDQILSPVELIAKVSAVCTLEPGDLICTGTPSGVGAASGNFLAVGDSVRVEVDGLGEIESRVVPEPSPAAAMASAISTQ